MCAVACVWCGVCVWCSQEAFTEAIRAQEPCEKVVQSHISIFYKELLKLAEEELEKKQRKRLRAEKDFKRLVKKYIDRGKLNPTPTFEEVLALLALLALLAAGFVGAPYPYTCHIHRFVCTRVCIFVCKCMYVFVYKYLAGRTHTQP